MSYAMQTCAECKQRMMATDGIMPVHKLKGKGAMIDCEGSSEPSVEADEAEEVEIEETDDEIDEPPQKGGGQYFKLEKGVPLPPKNGARVSKFAPLISAMEIGDSFLFSSKGKTMPQIIRALAKKRDIKVSQRRVSENEMRIWRIK